MNTIDKVIYINLDRRTDRRKEIEEVLDALEVPSEKRLRFSAIPHCSGWVGCTKSHYQVMKMACESDWSRVLILEDDFMPTCSPSEIHQALETKEQFDVLFLSSYVQASEAIEGTTELRRGLNVQTASAYIVERHFFERLCKNLEEAVRGAENGGNHWDYINDQYWKRLQADRSTRWLYFTKPLGRQRPSHSDLTGRFEDYGV
jgi:glycosyl transferase family 25